MKTVLTNDMVRHVWAQGDQMIGRTANGNFHFDGDTLYSYSTPIARRVKPRLKNSGFDWIFLISQDSYSPTTASKHLHGIHSAVSGPRRCSFTVPLLGRNGGMRREENVPEGELKPVHAANVAAKLKTYAETLARLRRKADRPGNWEFETLAGMLSSVQEYAHLFCVRGVKFPSYADDAIELTKFWDEKEARRNDPKYIAKRAKAAEYRTRSAERKEEKKRLDEYSAMQFHFVRWMMHDEGLYSNPHWWDFPEGTPERAYLLDFEAREKELQLLEWLRNYQAAEAGDESALPDRCIPGVPETIQQGYYRLYAEVTQRKHAAAIEAWRSHVTRDLPYSISRTVPAMLRWSGDTIETSQGASFPVSHAKRAWPVVKRCHDTGTTWQRNGHSVPLGVFSIDSIDALGNVRAGCHHVLYPEVERMARELGLIEEGQGNGSETMANETVA